MYRIIVTLLCIFNISFATANETELSQEQLSEIQMAKFLVSEVIPAFGGLKNALLTNKPKLKLQFNSKGTQILECSFEFRLQQLKEINFELLDIPLYEFNANASIGDERWLNFRVDCGDQSNIDTNHFKISFFVTDSEGNKTFYPLVVDALEQEQLDLRFYGTEMDIKLTTKETELLLASNGELSEFSKQYESYHSEGTLYVVPQDGGQNTDTFEKIVSVSQVEINGALVMSLPISVNGEKVQTQFDMPINGVIHTTDEGLTVPMIDVQFGE